MTFKKDILKFYKNVKGTDTLEERLSLQELQEYADHFYNKYLYYECSSLGTEERGREIDALKDFKYATALLRKRYNIETTIMLDSNSEYLKFTKIQEV